MPIQDFCFNMSLETENSVQWLLCQTIFTGLCPLQYSSYSQQVSVGEKQGHRFMMLHMKLIHETSIVLFKLCSSHA